MRVALYIFSFVYDFLRAALSSKGQIIWLEIRSIASILVQYRYLFPIGSYILLFTGGRFQLAGHGQAVAQLVGDAGGGACRRPAGPRSDSLIAVLLRSGQRCRPAGPRSDSPIAALLLRSGHRRR